MLITLIIITVVSFIVTGAAAAALGVKRYDVLIGLGFLAAFALLQGMMGTIPESLVTSATGTMVSFAVAATGALIGITPYVVERLMTRATAPARQETRAAA